MLFQGAWWILLLPHPGCIIPVCGVPTLHKLLACYSRSSRQMDWQYRGAGLQVTLILLYMAPKCKSCEAGNSEMLKRSRKGLSLSEKVKVLDLMRKEKQSNAEIAKVYGKNKSVKLWRRKKIRGSFAVTPQTVSSSHSVW